METICQFPLEFSLPSIGTLDFWDTTNGLRANFPLFQVQCLTGLKRAAGPLCFLLLEPYQLLTQPSLPKQLRKESSWQPFESSPKVYFLYPNSSTSFWSFWKSGWQMHCKMNARHHSIWKGKVFISRICSAKCRRRTLIATTTYHTLRYIQFQRLEQAFTIFLYY